MENRKDQGEKQSNTYNKRDEQQNAPKQMLGFDEVNFEQKREPYRESSNRSHGKISDRWTENRK